MSDDFERRAPAGWGLDETGAWDAGPGLGPGTNAVEVECVHRNRASVRVEGTGWVAVGIARIAFQCGCVIEPAPYRKPSLLERLIWRFRPPLA